MPFRWLTIIGHWFTVNRFRLGETWRTQSLIIPILQHRVPVLLISALIAAGTTAIDVWVLPKISGELDLGWLGDVLHAPSPDTSRLILEITATSAAAVLAIVLTISLIVVENASARLGNRIMRLAMDEPFGVYVVDLLIASLLVSLWGLFLLSREATEPVATPLAAVLLISLAAVSLVVYRVHALAFMFPSNTSEVLSRDIARAMWQAAKRDRTKPAIVDYLRRRVGRWLGDLDALARVITVAPSDEEGAAAMSTVVGALCARYMGFKPLIPEDSQWFPQQVTSATEEDGWSFFDQRRMFRHLGLGSPPRRSPKLDWVEEEIFSTISRLRDAALTQSLPHLLTSLTTSLSTVGRAAARYEDRTAWPKTSTELSKMAAAVTDENIEAWGGVLISAYLHIADAHLGQMEASGPPPETANFRWISNEEIKRLGLTHERQLILTDMFEKLQVERLYSGRIVTPRTRIQEELQEQFDQVKQWHSDCLAAISTEMTTRIMESAKSGNVISTGTWIVAVLAFARRARAREQSGAALDDIRRAGYMAAYLYAKLSSHIKPQARDALEDLLIFAIMEGDDDLLEAVMRPLFVTLQQDLAAVTSNDYVPLIRMFSLAGYTYLSAELDQSDRRRQILKELIESFRDPNAIVNVWLELVKPSMRLAAGVISQTIGRYHDLWLHFQDRIQGLPKTYETPPGRVTFDEIADHPSALVQRLSRWRGWEIEEVVEAMGEWFKGV